MGLDDRWRAAAQQLQTRFDPDAPSIARLRQRSRRRRVLAALTAAVVAIALVVVLLVPSGDGQRRVQVGRNQTEPTPTTTHRTAGVFQWPDDCTATRVGREGVSRTDPLAANPTPSWTSTGAGQWLEKRLAAAGYDNVYSVGSAFVLQHGADGVVFIWFGPPGDTAGLTLRKVNGVETSEISPSRPFDTGAYRPSVVDSVVAGHVRIWMLTHARDGYESTNFPHLVTAPCLPDQRTLRANLRRIAAAARQSPYRGASPKSAGRFAINSDVGISASDPGDVYLLEIGSRAVSELRVVGSGLALDDVGDIWVWSEVPPGETAADDLANTIDDRTTIRTSAGGLDIRVRAFVPVNATTIEQLRAIATALNREPFLGQPTT